MVIRCETCTSDPAQQENLCQCIKILGGNPVVDGDVVSVEYDGEKTNTMIQLFETFTDHSIELSPS